MSITSEALESAFGKLYERWQNLDQATDWHDVKILEQFGTKCLRIEKRLPRDKPEPEPQETTSDPATNNDEDEEDDEEVVHPAPSSASRTPSPLIVYEILHSPSYQVPVLYISFKSLPRPTPDEVYELLVPEAYRGQVRAVGVMGALSVTEHPITGLPVYFVHPCRTREVMAGHRGGEGEGRPEEYLLVCTGSIGASVGLSVPVELARGMMAGDGS